MLPSKDKSLLNVSSHRPGFGMLRDGPPSRESGRSTKTPAPPSAYENNDELQLYSMYEYDIHALTAPKKLLFEDYRNTIPKKVVDLKGWMIRDHRFYQLMRYRCKNSITTLIFDDMHGLTPTLFDYLRGMPTLRVFSMRSTIAVDEHVAKLIGSFPLLTDLDISGCPTNFHAFEVLSMSCRQVKKLAAGKCAGLDDFCLLRLAGWVERFRKLSHIDLSRSCDFTDEGVLALLGPSKHFAKYISFQDCKCLTTLALAPLRKKFLNLESLSLSSMLLDQSAFKWIGDGCPNLRLLNVSNSLELDDRALASIAKGCSKLRSLNVSKCPQITDKGMAAFFDEFKGYLEFIDLSLCIQLTCVTFYSLSRKADQLTGICLNGLSQVNESSLKAFWMSAHKLTKFEMNVELRVTATHRRSLMSRMSDAILKDTSTVNLREVKLVGAFQITDTGISAIARSSPNLRELDVSYCHAVTDTSLTSIADTCVDLRRLNLSGCGKISDVGVMELTHRCRRLTHLELNGCARLTDRGVEAVSNLRFLEVLGLRNCMEVTDVGLVSVARNCKFLKSLDISGLDGASELALREIVARPLLTSFNCESCNFSTRAYAVATERNLPLAGPIQLRCKLQPRQRPLVEYNKFVYRHREMKSYTAILEIFCKRVGLRVRLRNRAAENERRRLDALLKSRWREPVIDDGTEDRAAGVLQRWTRRCLAVKFAKRKLRTLRRRFYASVHVQRLIRGHLSRKRSRMRFRRLYRSYQNFGHFIYRILLTMAARRVRLHIRTAQSFGRMLSARKRFLDIRRRFVRFQVAVKAYLLHRRVVALTLQNIVLKIAKSHCASNLIKVNWRAQHFNKEMPYFLRVCSHAHRASLDTREWNIINIQRVFRGYVVRRDEAERKALPYRIYYSAVSIQSGVRRCLCRMEYRRMKIRFRKFRNRWRKVMVRMARLRLGFYAKTIQRAMALNRFLRLRRRAKLVICRAYRQHRRWVAHKALVAHQVDNFAWKFQRIYRLFRNARIRKERERREHMAAYVIQNRLRRQLARLMLMANQCQIAAVKNKQNAIQKRQLLEERWKATVRKLEQDFLNQYARRIQRVYRPWIAETKERREMAAQRKKLMDLAAEELRELDNVRKKRRTDFLRAPVRAAMSAATTMKKAIFLEDTVNVVNRPRLRNAVIRYQSQSLSQDGILELRLVMGTEDNREFAEVQYTLETMGRNYFVKIENDLSGQYKLNIFLWKKFSQGTSLITDVQVHDAPKNLTIVNRRQRFETEGHKGNKMAWHLNLPFELHGYTKYSRETKNTFAVQDLEVAIDAEECDILASKGFECVGGLSNYGFSSTIWVITYQPEDDDEMYDMGLLPAMAWYKDEILALMKTYELAAEDVFKLRSTFERIAGAGEDARDITLASFRDYMGLEKTKLFEWVMNVTRPVQLTRLTFVEYMQTICFFILFGKRELLSFFFNAMDEEHRHFLDKKQFCDLVAHMGEGSGRSIKHWQYQWKLFHDPASSYIFFSGFKLFAAKNPSCLWVAQSMQRTFMDRNIGVSYWERKMEQFRLVRKEMNVELYEL